MASFLNQVGSFGQSFGQTFNQTIGQGLSQVIEELRVGKYSVLVKDRIAEGRGFGVIDIVTEIHSNQEFVLKRCNIDRAEFFEIVKKEISILQEFTSPYIVKLLDSAIIEKNNSSKEALLLMEYYPGGHLLERLNKRNGTLLPLDSIYRIFGYILLGVKPFHEHRPIIINRDLKLENILFGTDGKTRLCDFGSCKEGPIYIRNVAERQLADESIQRETTQMYRAPEMVNLYMRDILTERTDIWALGCIFYSLCFLRHPFQDQSSLAILAGKFQIPKSSPFPPEVDQLIFRMLDLDPESRPTVNDLLNWVVELAGGRPLPPHSLSEEALRRRTERLEADKLDVKSKKKPVANDSNISRKGTIPSADSVAAKRLAAKRIQTMPTQSLENVEGNNTLNSEFAQFPSPMKVKSGVSSPIVEDVQESFEGLDFFSLESNVSKSKSLHHNNGPCEVVNNNLKNEHTFDTNLWGEFDDDSKLKDVKPVEDSAPSKPKQFEDEVLISFDEFPTVASTSTQSNINNQPVVLLDIFDQPLSKTPAKDPTNRLNVSDPIQLFDLYEKNKRTTSVVPPIPSIRQSNSTNISGTNSQIVGHQHKAYPTTYIPPGSYQSNKRSDPFDSLNILQK